jgi:hypothetical protein
MLHQLLHGLRVVDAAEAGVADAGLQQRGQQRRAVAIGPGAGVVGVVGHHHRAGPVVLRAQRRRLRHGEEGVDALAAPVPTGRRPGPAQRCVARPCRPAR